MANGQGQFFRAIAAIFRIASERLIDLSPKLQRDLGERFDVCFSGHEGGSDFCSQQMEYGIMPGRFVFNSNVAASKTSTSSRWATDLVTSQKCVKQRVIV